ncbi:MAG TPA: hypothetical protein VMT12_17830 [Syntrophales bacterium]|nr:hypothetical protein [Syntrophales bacterium]
MTNAKDKDAALEIYNKESKKLIEIFERSPNFKDIQKVLIVVADNLKKAPIKRCVQDTPSILFTGESLGAMMTFETIPC